MSEFDGEAVEAQERILSDEMKRALALQSVRSIADAMDVAIEIFPVQHRELRIVDDLTMCVNVLRRAAR